MKKILLVFAGLFILLAFVIFAQSYLRNNISFFQKPTIVKLGNDTKTLEVADSPEERQQGLSGKNSLGKDRGMLFVFDSPDYPSFWMKDMKFPIDIIFLNDSRVVTVHPNVQPPQDGNQNLPLYSPTEPANRVLELNAGQAEQYNIENGTMLDITIAE